MKKVTLFYLSRVIRYCTPYIGILLLWSDVIADTLPVGGNAASPADEAPIAEMSEVQVTVKKKPLPQSKEGSAESGYRAASASMGPLGTTPLKDTPFSINVTPGELIENRQAHTLFDALQTNPTVSNLMVSNGYSSLSRVMIRGFTAADQSELRDGLVDRSFTFPPLENVERIEVMNGLSSFLYGFSAIGGTINYVSKQPSPTPIAALTVGQYGGGINYVHADLGGPFPLSNDRLTSRFNIYREDGDTCIDQGKQKRTLLSGALAYRLLPGTVLKWDIYYQDYTVQGLQTYFNAPSGNWSGKGLVVPSASEFDAAKQYGQSYTYNDSVKILTGFGLESKLNDIFTLRAAYRYGTMWRQYAYVGATLADNLGNYTEKFTATPRQNETTHSAYALIDASVDTWMFHHNLTFGYTGTGYDYSRGDDVSKTLGVSNIYSPVTYADPMLSIGTTTTYQKQYLDNFLIGDRIMFNRSLSALIGINYAQIRQEAWGTGNAISTSNFTQARLTPSISFICKPHPDVSSYFSYIQGLAAGGTAPTTAVNANQTLEPSVSEQYEVGVKSTLWGMNLAMALFRINKINEYTDPSDNTYKQDGREVHQGIEVTASGKISNRLTLVGGLTLMDAHIEKAKSNPAIEGKIPINVPEEQFRAYLEYALPYVSRLTASMGANYFGRRPVDALNDNFMPGAATFDAGLRYQPRFYGQPLTLNLTVSNLLDTRYWSYYRSGDGLLLGGPRQIAFSARIEW